jgi:hypothetical protein
VPARFRLFLAGVEPEPAVIHEAAYRGTGLGRDFHEVELSFFSYGPGPVGGQNAELLVALVDQPDLRYPDLFVDPQFLKGDRRSLHSPVLALAG